ncbi:zinc finger protein ZAT9-like [Rhodamnia argentea]|uniref:Zinc finger protein ZAT9-like n=1 Tax=Rhodamnia argentea TaxID=178133 RepID=A0ABM3HYZ6_9MYRT|nr:zinc finger protein ZAT9-like [Rhodamnia argentea]
MLVTYSFFSDPFSLSLSNETVLVTSHNSVSFEDCHFVSYALLSSAVVVVMERHKCKLCSKSFCNGRALGGHMRSHLVNLPLPPKPEEEEEPPPIQLRGAETPRTTQWGPSPPSSSSSEEEGEGDEEAGKLQAPGYGLRENPKKSVRLADPEFAIDAGSVVLQDRESETESSKNPTGRRPKSSATEATTQRRFFFTEEDRHCRKKTKRMPSKAESASSISDETTEADLAFCLMMLSRDKWRREKSHREQENVDDSDEEEDEDDDEEEDEKDEEESEESKGLVVKALRIRNRGNYRCETCNRTFRSYQALGGHRASHKKSKLSDPATRVHPEQEPAENVGENANPSSAKVHECPFCFRVFASGQALGGHKRSHAINSTAAAVKMTSHHVKSRATAWIDLNLPAPVDDDEDEDDQLSQVEHSALSEAEFVNRVKR